MRYTQKVIHQSATETAAKPSLVQLNNVMSGRHAIVPNVVGHILSKCIHKVWFDALHVQLRATYVGEYPANAEGMQQ